MGGVFMSTFLSKDVLAGLEASQKTNLKKKNRLHVEFNKNHYPIIWLTQNGFCVEAEMAPMIRGLVDLYDGDNELLVLFLFYGIKRFVQRTTKFCAG